MVLKWLSSPVFEPLNSTSLRNLTKKTLLLVALATAKRVSEIHATQGGAVCSYTQGFLAKNKTPSKPWPCCFNMKNLVQVLGLEDEERVLCPVRALKYYLRRTEKIRGPASNFWCLVKDLLDPLRRMPCLSF